MKERILLVVKSIAVLIIISLICILFTYKCEHDSVVDVYTITFNSAGGTKFASQQVEEKNKVMAAEALKKSKEINDKYVK
jgi:hypothetical protein